MDKIDQKILAIIQEDISLPLSEVARRVGLSKTPCWNRIKSMEEKGIIVNKVAILDNSKINLPIVVFLSLSVSHHTKDWVHKFAEAIKRHSQIVEVHRVTGSDIDYLLKIVASSVENYDAFQQKLINQFEFSNMSSSIALKVMKKTNVLPLDHLG